MVEPMHQSSSWPRLGKDGHFATQANGRRSDCGSRGGAAAKSIAIGDSCLLGGDYHQPCASCRFETS